MLSNFLVVMDVGTKMFVDERAVVKAPQSALSQGWVEGTDSKPVRKLNSTVL